MSIPNGFKFLIPWRIIEEPHGVQDRSERLSARLQSEVPEKHVLYGLKVRAVATRVDQDDVLFEIEGGHMPLAVVHMTWRKETDPHWPRTKLFPSWDDWVRDDMLPAHEEYGPS